MPQLQYTTVCHSASKYKVRRSLLRCVQVLCSLAHTVDVTAGKVTDWGHQQFL